MRRLTQWLFKWLQIFKDLKYLVIFDSPDELIGHVKCSFGRLEDLDSKTKYTKI